MTLGLSTPRAKQHCFYFLKCLFLKEGCFLQSIKDLQCFIHAQPGIISSVLHFKPASATTSPAGGSCISSA